MRNWIRNHSIGITLVPVILTMALIFSFSAQTGEVSGQLSGNITRALVGLFVWDLEAMSPAQQQELLNTVGLVIRKGAHFSEYALLGLFLMLHIREVSKRTSVRFAPLWAWGIGTLYAVTDELHQGFVGGRHPALTDVMIDSSGVITGVGILLLLFYGIRRKNAKK